MYRNYFKRYLDIVLSLVLALPILIICSIFAIFIKLEDKGPVLYCGKRIGKNRSEFKMYKLRSMKINAPDIRNTDGSTFNSKNDPRLLKIGKFLRMSSIDELPQLINVFLGDMSFVGPRPDLAEQSIIYDNENLDKTKFQIKPGVTGYAQCNGRNNITWKEKLKLDNYYVKNCSFTLDVKIIVKTVINVLGKKGINQKEVN